MRPLWFGRRRERWLLDVTADAVRAAIRDPSAWGETLGPNLVTNGDGDSASGWTASGNASVSAAGGRLRVTLGTDNYQYIWQTIATIAGRRYRIAYDAFVGTAGGVRLRVGSTGAGSLDLTNPATQTSDGAASHEFTATGTATTVSLLADSSADGVYAEFDNLSVREVITGWLMPGTARLRLSGDSRASATMARQQDGTFAWEPHNLLANAELAGAVAGSPGTAPTSWNSSFSTGSITAVTDLGRGCYSLGFSVSGTRRVLAQNVVATAAASYHASITVIANSGLTVSQMLRYFSRPANSTEAFQINGTTASGGAVPVAGDVISTTVVTTDTGGTMALRIGAGTGDVATGTCTLAYPAAGNGTTIMPFIPTSAAARYAPGVEWVDGAGWRGQAKGARANLALWTADMGNAAWATTGTGATKVGAASALGDLPMHRINVGTAGGSIGSASAVYRAGVSFASGTAYTVFALVRSVTGTSPFRMSAYDGAGADDSSGDLTATTTAQVFALSFTANGTTADGNIAIRAATAGGAVNDIDVGGIVVCTGALTAADYVPILTWGSTVTRTADAALVLLPATIAAGTLVVDYIASGAGSQVVVDVSDGTAKERHRITHDGVYTVTDGGSTQANPDGGTPNAATRNRVAIGWAADDFAVSLNGASPVADTSGTVPTVDRVAMGETGGGWERVRVLDRKMPNGRIQGLAA